jgi:hypothetical protein
MPTTNPFRDRPPAKKRIINASVTAEQAEAFDALQSALGLASAGAVIKLALAELADRVASGEFAAPVTAGEE